MQNPTFQYLVTRDEESGTSGIGPFIPTFGHMASAFDAYRVAAVTEVLDRPDSWCFTDTDASAALGRIIDGPINSKEDIEKAESALRAILLHEQVNVVVPTVKAEYGSGLVGYVRLDKQLRSEAAFAGFQVAPCQDLLLATEYVRVKNGQVSSSSYYASRLIGKSIEQLTGSYRDMLHDASDIASALAMNVGASSLYTSDEMISPVKSGPANFIDQLYRRIYRPWLDIAQSTPTLNLDVKLPPLVAIVLSRASTRSQIPTILRDLRAELEAARRELVRLNLMLESSVSQAELASEARKINESFDAIVPEALLTKSERRNRSIASVFNFVRPIRQIYSVAVDPLNSNPEKFQELFASIQATVAANSKIVSRSVAAETLAELLRVDSIRNIVTSHFTKHEQELLQH